MRSDRWMMAAMALCLSGIAAAAEVENVSASSVGGRTEVVIEGSGLPRPRITSHLGGRILAVEFGASLRGKSKRLDVNANGLRTVRVGWRSARPAVVRVDLRLEPGMPAPSVSPSGHGWRIAFGPKAVAKARPVKVERRVAQLLPLPSYLAAAVRAQLRPVRSSVVKRETVASMLPASPPMPKPEELRVSLDFVNTEIVQILKALALQAGVNVVTAPEVKGTLTVSLQDVTVETALKLVTSLAGIDYTRFQDTYIVATRDRIDSVRRQVSGEAAPVVEPPVTEVYHVQGGNAATLVQSVAGGKGEGSDMVGAVKLTYPPKKSATEKENDASAKPSPDGKSLVEGIVMRGPAAEVRAMRELFEKLLVKGESASMEVLEVKWVDPLQLAAQLSNSVVGLRAIVPPPALINTVESKLSQTAGGDDDSGTGAKPSGDTGTGGVSSSVSATAMPMRLLLQGTADQIRMAREYAARVDLAPKQVALELRVMELSRNDALKLGIDWSILTGGTVRLFRMNQGLPGTEGVNPGNITGAFRGGSSVVATLDEIATRQNLIARPNLLAVDGRTSQLFVGDVVRYIEQIQATQNGTTVIIGKVKVGVQFDVQPRIGANDQVMLDLGTRLNYLTGFTPVPGGGQLPQTSERQSTTSTIMESGETIAIGGLILDQDRRDVRGVPILKDLPIIGQLFRRNENTKVRTEVVFFLTAKTVTAENRANAAQPGPLSPSTLKVPPPLDAKKG